MNIELLKEQIKRHEGEVLEIYEDSLGYLTLGVGHLIREDDEEFGEPAGTPVSQEVVDRYYDADFDKHVDETIHVCENNNIEPILGIDMMQQMGLLLDFKTRTIKIGDASMPMS